MKHTISGLVKNRTGVLERVAHAFSAFEINIKSIAVSETDLFDTSRMTIVVEGHDHEVRKITQKLKKLKEVIKVDDLARKDFVDRELALIKVSTQTETINHVSQIAELFGARAIAVGRSTITLELAGEPEKVDGLIAMLRPLGIRALARTGRVALVRGDEV
ncbi:MAG: acetolactate synthase small subunit [Planctomycetota bacterium]